MEDVVSALWRLLVRLVLLVAGVVFFLSLLAAALALALLWGLRALWARLSGRPMAPWVLRVDPRSGFQAMYRRSAQPPPWRHAPADAGEAEPPRHLRPLPGTEDVTDVEAREPREPRA